MQIDWRHFTIGDVYVGQTAQVIVGAEVQLPAFVFGLADIDIRDIAVVMQVVHSTSTFTEPQQLPQVSFNGLALVDFARVLPAITTVSINAASNLPGFDISRVSFDDDHVYANSIGLCYDPSSRAQLDLSFVPLPSTFAGFIPGLGCLLVWLRRRDGRA